MRTPAEWSDLYWRLLETLVLVVTTLNTILLRRLHSHTRRPGPVQPTYYSQRAHVQRGRGRGRERKRPRT